MNPFFQSAIINGVVARLKRTCPNCKRVQIVPSIKQRQTVPCRFCRTPIPAPSQSRQRP